MDFNLNSRAYPKIYRVSHFKRIHLVQKQFQLQNYGTEFKKIPLHYF